MGRGIEGKRKRGRNENGKLRKCERKENKEARKEGRNRQRNERNKWM